MKALIKPLQQQAFYAFDPFWPQRIQEWLSDQTIGSIEDRVDLVRQYIKIHHEDTLHIDFDGNKAFQPFWNDLLLGLLTQIPEDHELRVTLGTNIKRLNINVNLLSKLSVFKGLRQLTLEQTLNVPSLEFFSDLAALPDLPELRKLELKNCIYLRHLNGLEHVSGVTELTLKGCSLLKNLNGVEALSQLKKIIVSRCDNLQEIHSLRNTDHLKRVTLQDCPKLKNLNGLKNKNLSDTTLNLSNFKSLSDISGCGGFPQLKVLHLGNCKAITSFKVLSDLPQLETIDGHSGQLLSCYEHLKPSGTIQTLTLLKLDGFRELTSLRGLERFDPHHLSLEGCANLLSLEGIEAMKNISKLNLKNCQNLKSLEPLRDLHQITDLNLENCDRLQSTTGIESLTALTTLNVSGCRRLRSLSALQQLPALREIDISGCYALGVESELNFAQPVTLIWNAARFPLEPPHLLEPFLNSGNLTTLWLKHCPVGILQKFGTSATIQVLRMEYCPDNLIDADVQGFSQLKTVERSPNELAKNLVRLKVIAGQLLPEIPETELIPEGPLSTREIHNSLLELLTSTDSLMVQSGVELFRSLADEELTDFLLEFMRYHPGGNRRLADGKSEYYCGLLEAQTPFPQRFSEGVSRDYALAGIISYGTGSQVEKLRSSITTLRFRGFSTEVLENMTTLKILNLSNSPIKQLSGLSTLTALERLDLSNCQQLKTLPFASLPKNLRWLDISGCDALANTSWSMYQKDQSITIKAGGAIWNRE
ncbi:MAG: leucine-rich repeat protein [SAR324 cluster bacterium]|nr:leucine-rich repeat protein [SAR324 cluster bacterium]